MSRTVCFGEIMLRLNPEGRLKIKQAARFEASYAGAEANTAVSLANYGVDVSFVTRLPENELAEAAVRTLKANGVDTSGIVCGGERLGIYYLEKGASQRPSKVIYDRKHSAISEAGPGDFDWDKIFSGADWFHFTGITPALGENVAAITLDALKTARQRGLTVSCDLNYRKNLWSPAQALAVMDPIMHYVDVCIANEEDAETVLGIKLKRGSVIAGELDEDSYAEAAREITEKYGTKAVAVTLRRSTTADDNNWSGMLYTGGRAYFSRSYDIHIVDRVGSGDAFGGALIYAFLQKLEPQKAVEFAAAASCLKHTIEYDFNLVTASEVMRLLEGDSSGRVQR